LLSAILPSALVIAASMRRALNTGHGWRLRRLRTGGTPQQVKRSHPKASILKGGRVVFNIKANDYRLIAMVQYRDGVLMIRFFGSHEDYDKVDVETV
jgi:mRNA-degrading endonuclease HigB of HigAB toxin-antitoxin module